VLGQHARAFTAIFDRSQNVLRELFGAEMVLLPVRSKKQTVAGRQGLSSITSAYM
jgi:hypothetical protein